MTTGQRRALKGAGISTRRGFAGLAELPQVDRVSPDVLRGAQRQARLQVASEDDGVIRYEILDPERDGDGALVPNRGLLALPEPAGGDLFFDIEGARYYSEGGREFGLQYLFGVVDTAEAGEAGLPRYTQIRLATSLRRSYLPMQGPPGTGKTYTAAEQILELIAHGRRAAARPDLADAPGPVPAHLGGILRRQAAGVQVGALSPQPGDRLFLRAQFRYPGRRWGRRGKVGDGRVPGGMPAGGHGGVEVVVQQPADRGQVVRVVVGGSQRPSMLAEQVVEAVPAAGGLADQVLVMQLGEAPTGGL